MNKELTIMQQSFLDNLVSCNGDTKRAAELAGYAEGSYTSVVKALKTEIIELAENILAQNAPKASLKLVEVMDSTNPIPQANVRLQAAQTVLDRVGISKTDKLDVNLQNTNGLFILPAKQEVVIEGQYEEA
jgi:phage terminase small subunit|tara:strand:+ start:57 stop:449 length:393 start_codon:yes stop_codon:yes gene_type:complete